MQSVAVPALVEHLLRGSGRVNRVARLSLTPGAAIARQSVPYLGADACQIEQSFSKGEIDRLRGQLGRLS
ncbi:hypothetical protein [Trinickia soli]|uniref:Uncharacterized protein n=1 Tax=Trinickia soli TaxID=380675 RepID=A0A2N7VHX6_9BURK|nr:hypothetical protein [Trinickia soli]KAA0087579.1 hypothetical protein CIW54_13315 [Paraburkholderia sp. T12-10]PMS16750.1 hypothetical protein C0Z19_25340 [Trinickia soli]